MKLFLLIFLIFFIISSCKKNNTSNCDSLTLSTRKIDANIGLSNGSIIVTNPKGSSYTYSINSGAYQADTTFANLSIGNYSITVKNSAGCTASSNVTLSNPCTGVTINVATSKVDAITGQTNGSITVTSPVGSGYSYSINSGAFQTSTNFSNLGAGSFSVTAKSSAGCTGTTNVTLTGYGPKYYLVKTLILGYCGPCHINGGVDGGVNFDTDANIVAKWDRIKARAVDNLPTVMPQTGPLTTADKQKITDWVNAGHTINN